MTSEPPQPPRRPRVRERFDERFVDDYAWMRERDAPGLRAHLEAERGHALARIDADDPERRARLYAELRARIPGHERSVPCKDGPWLYYSRTEADDEYPRHCRRAAADPRPFADRPEQVYLDENALAADHDYFDLAALALSPDHRLCAYALDLDGDEIFTIQILDLERGELLPDTLTGCGASLAWVDDQTLIYTRLDPSQRPFQAWRHTLGAAPADDALVHQEDDGKFYLGLGRSRSEAFVVLALDSQVSSEVWLLPTTSPDAAPILVEARRDHVEYSLGHGPAGLFMLSNRHGRNFSVELGPVPDGDGGRGRWRTLIAHREDVLIEDIDVFARDLVVWERHAGLQRIRVVPLDPVPARAGDERAPAPGEHLIEFDDPCYALGPGGNDELDTETLRLVYTSLTTPTSIYDYDLRTRERSLRKRDEVGGGHRIADYASARLWAPSADGESVPISLVWRRDASDEASARPATPRPLILYAYGAYGDPLDPSFSRCRKSLLDRGAIWAIAHVRGGGELGRRWYEGGKLGAKHHSFDDFIACARSLIAEGWTRADILAGVGGSAGGLLIGAVANRAPELFAALVADVPFVDALNTMLDPELPLSLIERDEWGNPETAEGYAWLRAYSPYDNVCAQAYPSILALASWHDPRVGYWEPAKWIARLRDHDTGGRDLLLWINMDAGHAGASGRFEYLHEIAVEYAFLIAKLGLGRALPQPG